MSKGINFEPSTCPSSFIDLIEMTRAITSEGDFEISRRESYIPSAVEAQRAGVAALRHRDRMIRNFGGSEQVDNVSSERPSPTYERELSAFKRRKIFGRSLLVVSDIREIIVDPESDLNMYVMPVRYREEGVVASYFRNRLRRISLHLDPSNPVIVENIDMPKPSKLIEWSGELLVSVNNISQESSKGK